MPGRPRPKHSSPNHRPHQIASSPISRSLLPLRLLCALCDPVFNSSLPASIHAHDSRRKNPKRLTDAMPQRRTPPPSVHARNQVPPSPTKEKRETPQARQPESMPALCNSSQARKEIHRPIYQGQSQRLVEKDQERASSKRESSAGANDAEWTAAHRQSHAETGATSIKTNGGGSKSAKAPSKQTATAKPSDRVPPRLSRTCFHAANFYFTPPLPPEYSLLQNSHRRSSPRPPLPSPASNHPRRAAAHFPNIYGHFAENLTAYLDWHLGRRRLQSPQHHWHPQKISRPHAHHQSLPSPVVSLPPGGCFSDSYNWRDGIDRLTNPARTIFWHQRIALTPAAHKYDPKQFGTNEFAQVLAIIGSQPISPPTCQSSRQNPSSIGWILQFPAVQHYV